MATGGAQWTPTKLAEPNGSELPVTPAAVRRMLERKPFAPLVLGSPDVAFLTSDSQRAH